MVSGHKTTLRKHHSGVITSNRNINTILYFKKDIPIKLFLIKVETGESMPATCDAIISELKKTFLDKEANYILQSVQNLKITKKFNLFNFITEKVMFGHIRKKDLIQSILMMGIDDNTNNLIKMLPAIKQLGLNQINEPRKISNYIKVFTIGSIYSKGRSSVNRFMIKAHDIF